MTAEQISVSVTDFKMKAEYAASKKEEAKAVSAGRYQNPMNSKDVLGAPDAYEEFKSYEQ